jgi:hypothetical protein
MKRPGAFAASKLLVRQRLIRFDAHELVLRATVRAGERRCFGDWHGVGEVGHKQSTSPKRVRQTLVLVLWPTEHYDLAPVGVV